MKITKITADMLVDRGATCDQVEKFRAMWPDGAEVTPETCQQAAEARLDINWFAEHFLSPPALATDLADCAQALAAYNADCAQARAALNADCAPALATYETVCASALAAYNAACAQALAAACVQTELEKGGGG